MCDMIHLPPGPLRAANRGHRLGTLDRMLRAPGPAIGDGTGGSSSYRFRAGNAFSDTKPGSALSGTRQRPVPRPSGTKRCRDVSTPLPRGHATEVLPDQRRPARLPAGLGPPRPCATNSAITVPSHIARSLQRARRECVPNGRICAAAGFGTGSAAACEYSALGAPDHSAGGPPSGVSPSGSAAS